MMSEFRRGGASSGLWLGLLPATALLVLLIAPLVRLVLGKMITYAGA